MHPHSVESILCTIKSLNNRLVKLTVRIFTVGLCLAAFALQASAQSKRGMPTLDLQEYVISGVEKATHIGGDKMSLKAEDPTIDLPNLEVRYRPLIPVGQVIVQPQRPQDIAGLRFDFHDYSLIAGSFGSFNSNYNTAVSLPNFTLTANGWYDKPASIIRAGETLSQGLKSSILVRSADKGIFNFTGEFGLNSFLRVRDINQNISSSEFSLATAGSSVRSRLGDLNYSAKMNRWHLKGDTDNTVWNHDYRLDVSRTIKSGRLYVTLRQLGEPTELFDNDFNYSKVDIAHSWRQSPDWRISFGTSLFMTSSYTLDAKGLGTNRENTGIKLKLASEKKFTDRDIIYFQFQPIEQPFSVHELYTRYPMMSDSVGGVVESGICIKSGYRHELNQQVQLNAEAFYLNSLDHPVPVSSIDRDWYLETARFNAAGVRIDVAYKLNQSTELNAFSGWQDAKVSKGDIEMSALEEADIKVGIAADYRMGKWTADGDLVWYDQKPINLRGKETIPAHTEFNVRVSHRLKRNISLSLTAENLFNQHYYAVPGYDANPLTVMLGVSHALAK